MNYDSLAVQGAMFAGFAYDQLTEPVPEVAKACRQF